MQSEDPNMKCMTHNALQIQSPLRSGWTFIELLTTVVILAIVSVVIVPFATSGASASGQAATRLAVTELLAAQMDAVATQGYRRVHFFADGSGWCIAELESNELADAFDFATANLAVDVVEAQGQGQLAVIRFTEDSRFNTISIRNVSFDGGSDEVTFDPTGGIVASNGAPSTGGSFELQSGEFEWLIQLAPLTGKITVSEIGGAP
jgi:type II secretory pathway pseudopilin PulG